MIRKLTSGSAGQLAGSKPRDKGRLGRPSDPTGRNASEVRAGLERVDADADPPFARGRPRGQGSNRRTHLPGLPGYWTQHVGMVMRVIEGDPSGSEVAASTPLRSGGSDGCRTGSYDRRSRVTPAEERTLTSGALSTWARWGREGFDFLGYTLGPRHLPNGGRWYLGASPSKKSVQRVKLKVGELLVPGNRAPGTR